MSSVRSEIVRRLCSSLLGPQGGLREVLPQLRDPVDEYLTGVLAPQQAVGDPSESLDDVLDEGPGFDDDEDDEPEPVITAPTAPVLDPRRLPVSIGLSFVVRTPEGELPSLRVCATFARYRELGSGEWIREPTARDTGWIRPSDRESIDCSDGVQLQFRLRPRQPSTDTWQVTVYLVNTLVAPSRRRPPVQHHVFQPQIRVILGEHCEAAAVRPDSAVPSETDPDSEEDESLALLYRDKPALARGHLCAAVWSGIDPERPAGDNEPSPFTSVDLELLDVKAAELFRAPDLRTELLPLYPVVAPQPAWREVFGEAPEARPEVLADLWNPAEMRARLTPLVAGYTAWIDALSKTPCATTGSAPVVARHLELCASARDRIQQGIDLVCGEEDARLAFCFANRAIAMQAEWRGKPIEWRPFQLAFILTALAGIADPEHHDRGLCDLLWFPTGGGKTEAYLGLAAFTLALRRLRDLRHPGGRASETGTGVLSRYTLRLLAIQQFRRALGMITACEVLRVTQREDGNIGWQPSTCTWSDDALWGTGRFSVGLWVGRNVTPNKLDNQGQYGQLPGALALLKQSQTGHGEPAQVLGCPACGAVLAVPGGRHGRQERAPYPKDACGTIHLTVYSDEAPANLDLARLHTDEMQIVSVSAAPLSAGGYWTLTVRFIARESGVTGQVLDRWADEQLAGELPALSTLACARASRPGYFFRLTAAGKPRDFEIWCPAPDCSLSRLRWHEHHPGPNGKLRDVLPAFQAAGSNTTATRIPIPAVTVDEHLYAYPPSLLIATVDKLARLPFEPVAAVLFGGATHYHPDAGYYRAGQPRRKGANPAHPPRPQAARELSRRDPPDLILQDELHLIDGPLGSMVGLYETVVETLCQRADGRGPGAKYIASTATVRAAAAQVQSLFGRKVARFPPSGLRADDSFFALTQPAHPGEATGAGRLYLGVCAPGRGAQTPIIRIWSTLLQAAQDLANKASSGELDTFWTLVGYFNAIRELAGAAGLYRQDIPQRLQLLTLDDQRRQLSADVTELSSRADSMALPSLLARLDNKYPDAEDVVLATAMFGTGVDVDRLGLMVVHGQPKTTAAYIQATGRVGRQAGGLVVTFLRAGRPRDLDHFEFFTGYHHQLYRGVEPVTVAPFSPRARERSLGPLCVALLRAASEIDGLPVQTDWRLDPDGARMMGSHRLDPEVKALPGLIEARAQSQPDMRAPEGGVVDSETRVQLDRWKQDVKLPHGSKLHYVEYSLGQDPTQPVVLGDAQHQQRGLPVVYRDAPQSLREVEPTTGFQV